MKTIVDVSAFLKRTGVTLSLSWDAKGGKFIAHTKGTENTSKYLDDALDNLQESMRRQANAMQPVRETKAEAQYQHTTIQMPAGSQPIKFNISFAPSGSPPKAAQYPTCPKCGAYPRAWSSSGWSQCGSAHSWTWPAATGMRVKGDAFNNKVYEWDGTMWNVVTP